MRLTRTGMYVLTVISTALYVALVAIFSKGMFSLNHLLYQADPKDHVKVYSEGTMWTYIFIAIIVIAGLYMASRLPDEGVILVNSVNETGDQVDDPAGWRAFIGNKWMSILWLPLRFYVGMDFFSAGEHKLNGGTWSSGTALKGFWTASVGTAKAPAKTPYDWYGNFLQYMLNHHWYTWFASLIQWGEVLVGLGLIFGALTGLAAFFGTFLNMNFLLAGTVSSNPVLFGLGVLLVLGWKVAGYIGLDRYLLPVLGAPWAPGTLVRGQRVSEMDARYRQGERAD